MAFRGKFHLLRLYSIGSDGLIASARASVCGMEASECLNLIGQVAGSKSCPLNRNLKSLGQCLSSGIDFRADSGTVCCCC